MRVLFSFIGGNGHFRPLVPIARAVESAGHTIVFACSSRRQSLPESETFPTLLLDQPKSSKTTPEMTPLRPLSVAREEAELRENFARRGAQKRVPGMITACQMWKPDIIVCDEVDFGTMIAAEYLGIPHATVVVIASGSFIRPDVVAEPLNELRREYSLPEDSNVEMLSRYLVFNPTPPSFRDPKFPLPPTAQLIYPFEKQDISSLLPIAEYDNSLPTVYFTLGTVFNIESGDLFSRVLAGLRNVEANIIVTVGKQINPEMFGSQPNNIHIAQFIPQAEILPHCDLVISHGGSGTVIATLAHGLPMILMPMGADQINNASRCQSLGFGEVLNVVTMTSSDIAETVNRVLADTNYRKVAEGLKAEMDKLPPPTHAVSLLERLSRNAQPIA